MNKIAISILAAAILISGSIILWSGREDAGTEPPADRTQNNVVVSTEGKQVIEIDAKGGYLPRVTNAKANTPTVIKMRTSGTFDCSSALTIPALDYRTYLPPTGEVLIEVPPQEPGSTLRGLCSMGMYSFAVNFN